MGILRSMIAGAAPEAMIGDRVSRCGDMLNLAGHDVCLAHFPRIHCLGAGKGASRMFSALFPILKDRLRGGMLIVPGTPPRASGNVRFLRGNHPLAGRLSIRSTRKLLAYIDLRIHPEDLVIVLVTGGASALLAAPRAGIPFKDWRRANQILLGSRAPIREINSVRTAISRIKGGGLARRIHPATLWTLVISDVIGSPPETIGSGPTVISHRPGAGALAEILNRSGIDAALFPESVRNALAHPENPPPLSLPPENFVLLGDNSVALQAGCRAARTAGFHTGILTRRLRGTVDSAARRLARVIHRHAVDSRPRAWVFGGETTVRITGRGKGGRNQELVMRMIRELRNLERPFFFASAGSDGIDGPTSAAGAWITRETTRRLAAHEAALTSALRKNDSYRFFRRFGGLIQTGPTGTNIMDLGVILLPRSPAR